MSIHAQCKKNTKFGSLLVDRHWSLYHVILFITANYCAIIIIINLGKNGMIRWNDTSAAIYTPFQH